MAQNQQQYPISYASSKYHSQEYKNDPAHMSYNPRFATTDPEQNANHLFEKQAEFKFIRKVQLIWAFQYLVATILFTVYTCLEGLQKWAHANVIILYLLLLGLFVILIILQYVKQSHSFTGNVIRLVLITMFIELLIIALDASHWGYHVLVFLLWFGVATIQQFAIIPLTLQTKFEVNKYTVLCFCILVEVIFWGVVILSVPLQKFSQLDIIFCVISVLYLPVCFALAFGRMLGRNLHNSTNPFDFALRIGYDTSCCNTKGDK